MVGWEVLTVLFTRHGPVQFHATFGVRAVMKSQPQDRSKGEGSRLTSWIESTIKSCFQD